MTRPTIRREVLGDLLLALDECPADVGGKAEFRRLIYAVGARHGVGGIEQSERVEFARRLLAAGEPRATIRDRLMARFEVGESQAYRDIGFALQTVPKTAQKWD